MLKEMTLSENMEVIQSVIQETADNSDRFAETLRRRQVPHISFSQISTVEFCHRRYYLQYIARVDPDPFPSYFTKGKVLHQAIANSYAQFARKQPISTAEYLDMIRSRFKGEDQNHLENAFQLHIDNMRQESEVIAIEQPFVMAVADDLPPCVGVIDLILNNDGQYIIIDHKTGRDFSPQDELQMAIYLEFFRRTYPERAYTFYYEQYRWVNNLARLRKPPFQRIPVSLPPSYWKQALQRINLGHQAIQRIRTSGCGERNGECFRCPFRNQC